MVANVNIVDAASLLAMNDTKKYFYGLGLKPEDIENSPLSINGVTAFEYYQKKYDYYFDILLENSEQ